MFRHIFDNLRWIFRQHYADMHRLPAIRYYLKQLTRRPMHVNDLSIDPRGEWSLRKAQRVLDIINPQALAHGLFFTMLEITTHNMRYRRAILVAYCIEHEIAVAPDSLCAACVRHIGHDERVRWSDRLE